MMVEERVHERAEGWREMEVPNFETIFGKMRIKYKIKDEEVKEFVKKLDERIRKELMEMLMNGTTRIATCFVDECVIEINENDVKEVIKKGWEPSDIVEVIKISYPEYIRMWLRTPNSSITVTIYTPDVNEFTKSQYVKYKTIEKIADAFRRVKELRASLEECKRRLEELERSEEDEEGE